MPFLLRLMDRYQVLFSAPDTPPTKGDSRRIGSPTGASTLIDSAPKSASTMPQNGPAP